ncbi:FAD-dependent oxidoreductase [Elysia marginata]|uniref:FAD-dependent oxidoreductase n=1 Tax=Elysia marginata TaxID=1093978 RepID=A0AAV4GV90_9GAST|nr:FAD-dependent oxidoreductase [Elysia marginata]
MTELRNSREQWEAMAAELTINGRAFINGEYTDAASGDTFECRSPIDNRVLAQVASCNQADVDQAVANARATFEAGSWSRMAPAARKQVMIKLAGLLLEHKDELALLETLDMGKPIEAEAAAQQGARLFEYSKVNKIQKGDKPKVFTDKGSVTADFLILGGNAYLGDLEPAIGGKVLPAGSYIIATEPLELSVHNSLIPSDYAICDMSVALDYFRLSADKRLLFGGMCNYSGRDPKDIVESMRPKMLKVFPQLKDARIDYQWGGMIGIGANRMPQIGRLEPNIYYAQAYSGHGVNATHTAARVLAEAISGQAQRFDAYAKIRHMTFPGGKTFRSPLLALGMLWYRLKDML